MKSAVVFIRSAISESKGCKLGLIVDSPVFQISCGPSGDSELISLIYTGDPRHKFWYGHIRKHPERDDVYVSLLVWSDILINAPTVPLLFSQFNYWIEGRREFEPCTVQSAEDAYMEADSFIGAVENLGSIISRFEINRRCGFEGSIYEMDPVELRIMDIYCRNLPPRVDGDWSVSPAMHSLKVV